MDATTLARSLIKAYREYREEEGVRRRSVLYAFLTGMCEAVAALAGGKNHQDVLFEVMDAHRVYGQDITGGRDKRHIDDLASRLKEILA
jgi:hypothetical protein